ncbi:hypothetical protein SAMN05421578_102278 [Paenibacillus macquariensis]|uniref:Uncharacterized protein n=1 Tax=Paenibacillus macquariensis TaxID=948756 RepID=A0ABY1JNM9_9BACL|nr:hypothetical protein SAMN05421578_102278 [Paenibacillus macquariensis]
MKMVSTRELWCVQNQGMARLHCVVSHSVHGSCLRSLSIRFGSSTRQGHWFGERIGDIQPKAACRSRNRTEAEQTKNPQRKPHINIRIYSTSITSTPTGACIQQNRPNCPNPPQTLRTCLEREADPI